MKIDKQLLEELTSDLGLNQPFVKGRDIPVEKCWHFSTDGNAVDLMFYDEEDFIRGMNRVYITLQNHLVMILAFTLMDNHIHFVLYGEFDECNQFMHDYVRRTAWHISVRHGEKHKLNNVPIHHQVVDTDFYLKTVICYTIKNAPVAGIRHNAWDYPWSSGPLYFKKAGYWCSPDWAEGSDRLVGTKTGTAPAERSATGWQPFGTNVTTNLGYRERLSVLQTKQKPVFPARMIGQIVFPGDYVAYEVVEKLFRTNKGFNFFMCFSKEDDVESRGGTISHLSIPIQEMRQHKNEVCMELFGTNRITGLSTNQRLKLARTLKARYNSSLKQIIRLSGLVYDEARDML